MMTIVYIFENTREFSFMGCQHNAAAGSPADRRSQNSRLIREACQSISIQDCGCLACERCQHFVPHRWANAAARAQDRGVSSFVGEELAKLRRPVDRPDHDRNALGGIYRQSLAWASDCDKPRACPERATRG